LASDAANLPFFEAAITNTLSYKPSKNTKREQSKQKFRAYGIRRRLFEHNSTVSDMFTTVSGALVLHLLDIRRALGRKKKITARKASPGLFLAFCSRPTPELASPAGTWTGGSCGGLNMQTQITARGAPAQATQMF
jgi:hypothetical protein